jgi:hypothetical protein
VVHNNFDEGGTSFSAEPTSSAEQDESGSIQDDVDSTSQLPGAAAARLPMHVYFTLTRESPSLNYLPGSTPPSGANVYFSQNPFEMTPVELYVSALDLMLQPYDDIDALVVFDRDMNGSYSEPDLVLFSLDPESPSLIELGGPADVFLARPGFYPEPFALAADFGLGAPPDNIDALDFLPTQDAFQSALLHGIRAPRGDLNCDGEVDFRDINPFVLALVGEAAYYAQFPDCDILQADTNYDGVADFRDINRFVLLQSLPLP